MRILPTPRERRHPGAASPRRWAPGLSCSICGTPIHRWQRFNWDHVIPMSRGGKRGRSNKAHAHLLCNSVKNDRYPFSLKTDDERARIRAHLRPETWARLLTIWAGGAD